jgi:hypothetical protein
MPLLKSNKRNDNIQHGNHFPENQNGLNTAGASFDNTPNLTHHHHGVDPAVRPRGVHDSAAVNAPGATTTVDGITIPATHAATKKQHAGASEKAFVGKLEHAVGTMLCSSTLRAKGIQKEQEAQALKVQAAELSAAERLEQEARVRRERAVAHGADPQILHREHGNPQSQQANLDMSTAVHSGAPNLAGVGSVSGPPVPGGAPQYPPQTNFNMGSNVPQQGMGASQVTGGTQGLNDGTFHPGTTQHMAGEIPHTAYMAPQGTQETAGIPNQQFNHPGFNTHPAAVDDSRYPNGVGAY